MLWELCSHNRTPDTCLPSVHLSPSLREQLPLDFLLACSYGSDGACSIPSSKPACVPKPGQMSVSSSGHSDRWGMNQIAKMPPEPILGPDPDLTDKKTHPLSVVTA